MIFNRLFSNRRKRQAQKAVMGYEDIEGWLTPAEATGLFEIASSLPKDTIVLEIGSWKGKSTYCIAMGLKKGIIHCIDPFNAAGEDGSKEIYESTKGEISLLSQFQNNLRNIPGSVSINIHKGYSHEFVGTIPNIGLLFIDGDHSIDGCKFDFENYSIAVSRNGFVAFHDYYPERTDLGPTWVIENLVKKDGQYDFYRSFDSLQVYYKKG
jgi:MMP 1-O-methyltransferase